MEVRSSYFFWLAAACAAIAILGFMPTYWLQVPTRTFVGTPLLHIHGVLNTAWVLFLMSQAWLISQGKIHNHRQWGLAGIALATAVVIVGYAAAIVNLQERLAHGEWDAARSFLSTAFFAMTLFATFTAAAIACTRRPEWHKRLMVAGTVSLVDAAAGRVGFFFVVGHGPGIRPGLMPLPPEVMPTIVGMLLQVIIVVGMIQDRRTRGSVHPAWIVALAVAVPTLLLKMPLSHTAGWLTFADWTTHIAG